MKEKKERVGVAGRRPRAEMAPGVADNHKSHAEMTPGAADGRRPRTEMVPSADDNRKSHANQHQIFASFYDLCAAVEAVFDKEWRGAQEWEKQDILAREKRAIIGYEDATDYYKERIRRILQELGTQVANSQGNSTQTGTQVANRKPDATGTQIANREFNADATNLAPREFNASAVPFANSIQPPWYKTLEDGIFAELYGLAGLAPWAYDETEEYKKSSSAKLIGDRLYCLIDGKSVLQPQRISSKRREQLKRALLLATPRERLETGFHEIYLHNGIRISIFSGERTKEDQEIMVFRKYVLRELTFEKMAQLGSIPAESVELFKSMVKIGFNVLFTGQVRAGKTAFMQCWQRYEDMNLEGLAIATDPETPWHELMPQAPIMQIVADGKDLQSISKALLRGDNDYVLLEEMRDADSYKLGLDITSIGTTRSKATIHSGSAQDIPYKMASAIAAQFGGDFKGLVSQVFRNWHYVFEFYQVPEDRGRKRLKSISEYRYDIHKDRVSIRTLCQYDEEDGKWLWKYHMGEDKIRMAKLEPDEYKKMSSILKNLERKHPIMENTVVYPRYYRSDGDDKDVR